MLYSSQQSMTVVPCGDHLTQVAARLMRRITKAGLHLPSGCCVHTYPLRSWSTQQITINMIYINFTEFVISPHVYFQALKNSNGIKSLFRHIFNLLEDISKLIWDISNSFRDIANWLRYISKYHELEYL